MADYQRQKLDLFAKQAEEAVKTKLTGPLLARVDQKRARQATAGPGGGPGGGPGAEDEGEEPALVLEVNLDPKITGLLREVISSA